MDYDLTKGVKVNPKILTHPNIPKPLHGIAPRVIKGDEWWDYERQKAYARNQFHCNACGVFKGNAEYFKYLEAHELYNIDYKKFKVKLKDIVALCHSCHSFIHSGRLWELYKKGEVDSNKFKHVVERGLNILEKNKLKPFYNTLLVYCLFKGMSEDRAMKYALTYGWCPEVNEEDNWNKWHMIIDRKKYHSNFKDIEEYEEYYETII